MTFQTDRPNPLLVSIQRHFDGRARAATARALLAGLLMVLLASSAVEVSRPSAGSRAAVIRGDVELFEAVVTRLRGGEGYYDAMGSELRSRRYPTASVFNWRTPLMYEAIASVSAQTARAALVGLAAALLALTAVALANRSVPALMTAGLVQIGAAVTIMVPAAPLLTESWAGVLLGLSVGTYHVGARRTAAGMGLMALFVRELAALYAVVCTLIALRDRRSDEAKIWGVGILAYFIYFGVHVQHVMAHGRPGDLAHAASWIYGGGPVFLLQTLKTNAFLLASPRWIPAASVLLTLLAAACAWKDARPQLRAAVLAYAVALMIVGQPFNSYWGLLTAPVWGFAAADGVDAVRQWFAESR